MHPVDFTANLHSSTDAQENEGQEHAGPVVQESQVLETTILENITDALIVLDHQWRITCCNEKAASIAQRKREELLGKNLWETFPLLVGSAFYQHCQQAAASGIAEQFEVKSIHFQKWMRVHIFPSAKAITILLNDITAQKQVQEQEHFQANILGHIRDSVIVSDLQGNITYWNDGAADIFGYTQDEMLGQSIARLYFNYDAIPLEQSIAKLGRDLQPIAPGEEKSNEWQLQHKDGTLIWADVKTTTLFNADGTAYGYIGVTKDITKRKHLDDELRRSKDQLEVILRNVDDGIVMQDATGKIIYANQQLAKRAGYSSVEEMLSVPPSDYWERIELTDEQGQPFSFSQRPGIRAIGGETNLQVNVRYVNKQTHEVGWALVKATAVLDRNASTSFVICVMQDITQFKELELRKDEFMINVSHELRTPLTSLTGFLELINEYSAKLDEPTKAKFFYRALENCQELTRMVNAVLDVLQVNHDTKPAQPSHLLLSPLVHEVIAQFDPRKTQEYQFQVNIPEQQTVWADEQYLHHILRNLLSNACKYAPEQTAVVISATVHDSFEGEKHSIPQVCICVKDAGPGIPPAEQPLLFEKFTRLKRDLASTVRGTGLGLYISKQFVVKMGGHIWVESSGQAGEGSRFCFVLPTVKTGR